jgi:hypothetical protein
MDWILWKEAVAIILIDAFIVMILSFIIIYYFNIFQWPVTVVTRAPRREKLSAIESGHGVHASAIPPLRSKGGGRGAWGGDKGGHAAWNGVDMDHVKL